MTHWTAENLLMELVEIHPLWYQGNMFLGGISQGATFYNLVPQEGRVTGSCGLWCSIGAWCWRNLPSSAPDQEAKLFSPAVSLWCHLLNITNQLKLIQKIEQFFFVPNPWQNQGNKCCSRLSLKHILIDFCTLCHPENFLGSKMLIDSFCFRGQFLPLLFPFS